MEENLKTRREHLKVLPLQKRLQFIEQIRKHSHLNLQEAMNEIVGCSGMPMTSVFIFDSSKQGHCYWCNINSKYFLS